MLCFSNNFNVIQNKFFFVKCTNYIVTSTILISERNHHGFALVTTNILAQLLLGLPKLQHFLCSCLLSIRTSLVWFHSLFILFGCFRCYVLLNTLVGNLFSINKRKDFLPLVYISLFCHPFIDFFTSILSLSVLFRWFCVRYFIASYSTIHQAKENKLSIWSVLYISVAIKCNHTLIRRPVEVWTFIVVLRSVSILSLTSSMNWSSTSCNARSVPAWF